MSKVIPFKLDQLLSAAEVAAIDSGHCPDCNHRGFVMGPRGGAAINIECGGCAHRFNVVTMPTSHHIVMGHRIPGRDQGGSDWS